MNQFDLMAVARTREDNPAIKALITAIAEAKIQAEMAKQTLQSQLHTATQALQPGSLYNIPMSSSELVVAAAQLSTALSKISHDFFTLACALQGLGENIDY